MEAIHEVTHVPMFAPTTKLSALGNGSNPDKLRNTTIAVTTEDDWTIIVKTTATPIKINGLSVNLNKTSTTSLNDWFATALSNNVMPMNKIPKPATTSPNIFRGVFLERRGIAPTNAKNENIGSKTLNVESEAMKVVMVVPTLAPMIHAHAWKSVIVPISVSLTSVTLVTSED